MIENIWTWLLNVIIFLVTRLLSLLPDGQLMINFVSPIVGASWVVLELAYMAFGNFNLTIVFASFAVSAIAWTIALMLAVIAWIKRAIKLIVLLLG